MYLDNPEDIGIMVQPYEYKSYVNEYIGTFTMERYICKYFVFFPIIIWGTQVTAFFILIT
jgi:hypothetical protein